MLNPETILGNTPISRVIDVRRRYEIATSYRPWLRDKNQHYEVIDRVTFDPDPESRWHLFGRAECYAEAVSSLLEQIGAEVAKGDA